MHHFAAAVSLPQRAAQPKHFCSSESLGALSRSREEILQLYFIYGQICDHLRPAELCHRSHAASFSVPLAIPVCQPSDSTRCPILPAVSSRQPYHPASRVIQPAVPFCQPSHSASTLSHPPLMMIAYLLSNSYLV